MKVNLRRALETLLPCWNGTEVAVAVQNVLRAEP